MEEDTKRAAASLLLSSTERSSSRRTKKRAGSVGIELAFKNGIGMNFVIFGCMCVYKSI